MLRTSCRCLPFAMSLVAAVAWAGWVPNPNLATPIAVHGGQQSWPAVAADGAGGAFMVWADGRDSASTGYNLYAQHIDLSGDPLWTVSGVPATASPDSEGLVFSDDLAPDGEGGLYLVFQLGSDTTPYHVRIQHLDAHGGRRWGASGLALDSGAQQAINPRAIADAERGVYVTWSEGDSSVIRAQRFAPDGTRRWGLSGIVVCRSLIPQSQHLVTDGNGGFIVAWQDYRSLIAGDVYAQRVDSLGVPEWAENGLVVCDEPSEQNLLQTCSDGAGGMLLAWSDSRFGDYGVVAQRIDGNGSRLWTPNGMPTNSVAALQYAYEGAIVSDGSGGAFVTWEDYRGPDTDIYVQHLDASGARLLSDSGLAVCAAAGNQFAPWSTTDGAGGLIVGWCDERAGAAARDIFAQRVDSNGATRWAAQGRPICNATGQQTSVSGCADLAGGAILAWRDRRDDAGDIYAARVASNGALGVLAVPPVAEGGHLSRVTVAPCPASGPLTLSFTLPREGDVEVEVFDITGRRVRSLMGGVRPNGLHSLQWDLRDDAGSPVDAGVYLARVRGSGEVQRSRTVVIR